LYLHTPSEFPGFVVDEYPVDGKLTPGYNVYLARRLDPTAKLGKLVSKAIKAEDVKHEVEKLIINYLKTKGE